MELIEAEYAWSTAHCRKKFPDYSLMIALPISGFAALFVGKNIKREDWLKTNV